MVPIGRPASQTFANFPLKGFPGFEGMEDSLKIPSTTRSTKSANPLSSLKRIVIISSGESQNVTCGFSPFCISTELFEVFAVAALECDLSFDCLVAGVNEVGWGHHGELVLL